LACFPDCRQAPGTTCPHVGSAHVWAQGCEVSEDP